MNAYDLLNKMAATPIEYGLWDKINNKPLKDKDFEEINGTSEISDRCIVMKPDEVWRRKLGTCWDCTLLEYDYLSQIGYKYLKCAYYETIDKQKRLKTTHSFLIYKEPKAKDNYYWFEYTWYKHCGLHGPYLKDSEIFEEVERIVKTDCSTDNISYWNKDFDANKLLSMDEIGIMDFVRVVNPSAA